MQLSLYDTDGCIGDTTGSCSTTNFGAIAFGQLGGMQWLIDRAQEQLAYARMHPTVDAFVRSVHGWARRAVCVRAWVSVL